MRLLCAFALVAPALLLGCGSAETGRSNGRAPTAELGHEGLYDLGDSFEGLPLTHATSDGDRSGLFVYGTCEVSPGSDGGCAPPLELQNVPLADRYPSKFELTPGQPSPCRRTSVRGVPAAVFATTGGALEVYAGTTVVVIWGSASQARRAALALRPSGAGDGLASRELPQPPGEVRRALRRCAADSVETNLHILRRTGVPIFWLGQRFERHPLARVEGDATRARFVYGSCAQEPDYESDAGCWAPLELIVEPLAASGPSRYAAGIECRWRRVRELPVALLPTAHTVQVFTGDTTVTMYARELALMLHAASALRPLAERRARVGPLPAPPASLVSALSERCMPAKHQP